MQKNIKYILCAFLISTSLIVHADPFRDGVVAYQKKQYQQALEAWLPLAESGHVLAQTLVGSMYAYGEGVERNDNEALKWLSLAANTGSAQAQYNLAILYENGFGVTANKEQALKWFKAAANQGRKDAATRLALLEDESGADKVTTLETQSIAETDKQLNNTINSEPKPTKQRIHIVLNSNDPELLGPPDIHPVSSIISEDYGKAWVNQQPASNYTIQLAASIELRLIKAFKKHINLSAKYADTTSTHNGRQWHALIYGSYETVREAKQAIAEFPDDWKTWQPWIKTFSSVKHIKE